MATLLSMLIDDDDKEGVARRKAMEHSRLTRSFQDGFLTYLSLTPWELGRTAGYDGSVFPVVSVIKSLVNIVSFQAKAKDFSRVTPGRATIKSISEISEIVNE